MVTPKQKAFLDELTTADDCVSVGIAESILGKKPGFYEQLKPLRAILAEHGSEINSYRGLGYRLETTEAQDD